MVKRLKDMYNEAKAGNAKKQAELNNSVTVLNKKYRDLIAEFNAAKEKTEASAKEFAQLMKATAEANAQKLAIAEEIRINKEAELH